MHVLTIAGEYNTPENDVAGAFILPQLEALAAAGCKVGVVYPDLASPRKSLRRGALDRFRFPIWQRRTGAVDELGVLGVHAPGRALTRQLWDLQARRLASLYVRTRGIPDILHAHFSFVARPATAVLEIRHVDWQAWPQFARMHTRRQMDFQSWPFENTFPRLRIVWQHFAQYSIDWFRPACRRRKLSPRGAP